jgi:hypothetical protein
MDEDESMGWFMLPEEALARVVADEKAPIKSRVTALEMIEHPPLELLRRLLVKETPNRRKQDKTRPLRKSVPSKLQAVAAIKYAREVRLRQGKKVTNLPRLRQPQTVKPPFAETDGDPTGNSLGI